MTSLASFVKKDPGGEKGAPPGSAAKKKGGAASDPTASLSASVRASFAKLSATTGNKPNAKNSGGANKKPPGSSGGENVVSVTYARKDVLVTGFPDGAVGVWKTTHRDAEGNDVDPSVDHQTSASVVRWTCSMLQPEATRLRQRV